MIHELERLRDQAGEYEANEETKRKLSRFVVASLIAPPEVGKLALANAVIDRVKPYETWGIAPTLTTRGRRYGAFDSKDPEPPVFQTADEGVTHANLVRRITSGEVAGYSIRPDDTIYAASANNFTHTFNILPTMPPALHSIQRAGFERTESIFITAEVRDWHKWLTRRAPIDWAEDAVENLEYAEAHAGELHFIRNSGDIGGINMAASEIIDVTLGFPRIDDRETELHVVRAMLKYAKNHTSQS